MVLDYGAFSMNNPIKAIQWCLLAVLTLALVAFCFLPEPTQGPTEVPLSELLRELESRVTNLEENHE